MFPCRESYLHGRNLREMSALHRQLARTLATSMLPAGAAAAHGQGVDAAAAAELAAAAAAAAEAAAEGGLAPPSSAVQSVLRRAMAAGWADQVARRVRSAEYVQKVGGLAYTRMLIT